MKNVMGLLSGATESKNEIIYTDSKGREIQLEAAIKKGISVIPVRSEPAGDSKEVMNMLFGKEDVKPKECVRFVELYLTFLIKNYGYNYANAVRNSIKKRARKK